LITLHRRLTASALRRNRGRELTRLYLKARGITTVYECAPGGVKLVEVLTTCGVPHVPDGGFRMVKALRDNGIRTGFCRDRDFDFFKVKSLPDEIQAVGSNPPFDQADAFALVWNGGVPYMPPAVSGCRLA
jgi:hypothetical protein